MMLISKLRLSKSVMFLRGLFPQLFNFSRKRDATPFNMSSAVTAVVS